MSFNSYQSPFSSKTHFNLNEPNLMSNPTQYHRSPLPKTQNSNTPEFQPKQFTPPSSMSNNLLNVGPKYVTNKIIPSQFDKKEENYKNSDMITAKSMVFIPSEKGSFSANIPKKPFAGLGTLSSMARTANKNFDDSGDFEHSKNLNFQQNSPKFQEEKSTTQQKYGNTLGQQLNNNFKSYQQKQPSVSSSMFFSTSQSDNSVYKSFINPISNNFSGSEGKKTGGLDFLMKYKKEQEEKKQKESGNVRFGQDKILESSKANENSHRNFSNPSDNAHTRLFHEYSAPNLNQAPVNHGYEPMKSAFVNKNESYTKPSYSQYDSPTQGHNLPSNYNSSTSNSPQQNIANPTFLSKYNSDKLDNRFNIVKNPSSNSNVTQNSQSIDSFSPSLAFAKKQKKVNEQFTPNTTPSKQKFMSPSFFKNKQTKLFSQAKTLETIPSPSSPKINQFQDDNESPQPIKSTLSDDGSNDSIDYMNEDFSSDDRKDWCLDDFELGDKLGKGAFGDVFIARQKTLGFMCVLKKMSKKRIKEQKREEHVIRELKIQMYLNHRHLTSMYGYFHDKEYIYLILEYLPDGNLSQIKKRKKTSQKETANILKQVCEGLMFMHNHQIIHRDIKPENIFCNEGYMKLGDFGCSICTDSMRKTVVSCLEYSSPEQLNGGAYNQKIDIWGIGILAYELLTGKSPYEKEIMNMAERQVDFSKLTFPQQLKLSELSKDFITSLLNVDPIDRLDIHEALQHKFITSNYEEVIQLH